MDLATPYGSRYHADWRGEDGVRYRFELRQAHYAGASAGFRVLATGGLVVERDAGHPLAPAVASRATLRWLDGGAAGALAGLPYGDVQGVLLSDRDADGTVETVEWSGYLVPGRFASVPGERTAATELGLNDGLGLLQGRAAVDPTAGGYDPAGGATLYARLAAALGPLASADGVLGALQALTGWRPGALGSGDPATRLVSLDGAWADDDGVTAARQDYMARSIAGRLNARLVQCPPTETGGVPSWRLVQRSMLAAGLGGADYAEVDALAAFGDGDGTDRSARGVQRQSDVVLVAAESHRDFARDLDTLLVNGSFEVADAGAIEAWTLAGDASVFDLADYDPEAANRVGVMLEDDGLGVVATATQQAGVVAGSSANGLYRWSGAVIDYATLDYRPSAAVSVGPWPLRSGYVVVRTLGGDVLKGQGVSVPCSPLLKTPPAGPNAPTQSSDSDAVDGAPLIPEGAVIRLGPLTGGPAAEPVSLRLTRPARVGDTTLTGDLDATLTDGRGGWFCYFGPPTGVPDPAVIPLAPSYSAQGREAFDALTFGTDVAGRPVGGEVRVTLYGPTGAPDPGGGSRLAYVYDDLALAATLERGRAAGGSVTRAADPSTRGEGALSLPLADSRGWPLGDGPLPDSPDRLRTDAGVDTGLLSGAAWTSDALATVAPAFAATSIDALAVADALAQFGGSPAPMIWEGRVLLRSGARYAPHRPLRLYHPDGAGGWTSALYWWDRLVWDVTAGTLDVSATELRLSDPSALLTVYELTS